MSFQKDIRELGGRVLSLCGFGSITATKALDGKGVREAQVRFSAEEIRDATPLFGQYGVASRPLEGADAVLVFVAGNRSKGIIVATNDRRYQIELAEGEAVLHDDQGQKVHVTRAGIVIDGAGKPITINGDVTLNGKLTATGDVKAGTISLQQHRHANSGGSGTGGTPVA